jgi:hypothetical protein
MRITVQLPFFALSDGGGNQPMDHAGYLQPKLIASSVDQRSLRSFRRR